MAFLCLGSGRPPLDSSGNPGQRDIVSVKKFARKYGFTNIKVKRETITLKGNVHQLEFAKDSRKVKVNGTVVWLSDAMVVQKRLWVLSQKDVELTLKPLILPTEVLQGRGHKTVVLDAGHGGDDSGAVSPTGLMEKKVVLDITHRVRAHLLELGYQVYLTRHDDRFLDLAERPRRAGKWDADVFVSIHANSGPKTAVGTESFAFTLQGYPSTNHTFGTPIPSQSFPGNDFNQANMSLAYAIHHSLVQRQQLTDRGVRRARFAVLKNAPCPAALVEVGFLSHPVEGVQLAQAKKRTALALSIATGIDNYLRTVKKASIKLEKATDE